MEKSNIADKDATIALNAAVEAARAGELIGEIATSSNEQSLGIEEVNINVSQMAEVTQQTAASAEETAATSVEMNNQIDQMKNILIKLNNIVHENKQKKFGTEA